MSEHTKPGEGQTFTPEEIFNNIASHIDVWLGDLTSLTYEEICKKPSPNAWCLGQVLNHLLGESGHYLKQIEICLSNIENADLKMSPDAETMFENNSFPDIKIEGPPSNQDTKVPDDLLSVRSALVSLRESFGIIAIKISEAQTSGKTQHPGLQYFNAQEWLQFSEMHFRHHLKQRAEIKTILSLGGS
ncbi:MAG: DinB family protein [Saprospiraceae bacterium]|nr:DinB family protein [Saprospiraceae bacterium]